jgi:hypothetical protein
MREVSLVCALPVGGPDHQLWVGRVTTPEDRDHARSGKETLYLEVNWGFRVALTLADSRTGAEADHSSQLRGDIPREEDARLAMNTLCIFPTDAHSVSLRRRWLTSRSARQPFTGIWPRLERASQDKAVPEWNSRVSWLR